MKRTPRTVASAAVTCVALLAAAGCSGKAAPNSNSSSGASGASTSGANASLLSTTPAAKGELDTVTWNLWEGEPYTLDPYHSADYKENTVNSNLCETLLAIQPDLTIKPNLATSWDNPDPLTWVLHLKQGVKFWDGTPMTADDVAWSMNNNVQDKSGFYGYLYGRVASVKATGADQVTVKLSKPDYLFINELASYAGVVVKKAFWQAHPKDVGTAGVGVMCTGPFKFSSWTKGDNITLVRNDNYWDPTRKPKTKKLVFKFITDEASATNAMLAGQIDGAYDPPLSGLKQLQSSAAGSVYQGLHESNMTMVYANSKGAMSNLKLRQALQMAVDWQGINSTVLAGTGTQLRSMMPPSIFPTDMKDALQAAYDKLPAPQSAQYDAAKKLVSEAGADAKKPIVFAVPAAYTAQQFGTSVTDAAKRIGLNFTLKVVPTDQYTNYLYDAKTRAGVDILFTDFWPNIPDPLDWLGIAALNGGSFNAYGYNAVDDLYGKAQEAKDPADRAKIIAQIQEKTTADLLPMVPGISHSSRLWLKKGLTGVPASFDYVYYPWAAGLGSTQ